MLFLFYYFKGIKAHHHFVSTTEDDQEHNSDKNQEEKRDINASNTPSGLGFFTRFRVCHDIIRDPNRYFNLNTLHSKNDDFDPSGGGDPVRSIGQYDYKENDNINNNDDEEEEGEKNTQIGSKNNYDQSTRTVVGSESFSGPLWLRFEPFILHVMCRSLDAASALMTAARPAFKNLGLTSFKHGSGKYIVAIWGDEGIDMPLTPPDSVTNFIFSGREEWLSQLVNERHIRNWQKIDRFVNAVRSMPEIVDGIADDPDWTCQGNHEDDINDEFSKSAPKKFDVVGDVALLHVLPEDCVTLEQREAIGNAILNRNKAIKVVAVRSSSLVGSERAPGLDGLIVIAGVRRSPLITSHAEYGIKCVVDLNQTFFSTRMAAERLRICQQVARGEKVLALFCGVGMDAMQVVARTEATVIAIELNPVAIACAERGKQLLDRNKAVKCKGAADRLTFLEGDAIEIMKGLDRDSFDRIIAPRPKEGNMDGDLGNGDGGTTYLEELLPLLKNQGIERYCIFFYTFAPNPNFLILPPY